MDGAEWQHYYYNSVIVFVQFVQYYKDTSLYK